MSWCRHTNSSWPESCPKPELLIKYRRSSYSTGSAHSRFSAGSVVPHPLLLTHAAWIGHHVPGMGTLMAGFLTQVKVETLSRHPMRADVGLEEGKPRGTQHAHVHTYTYTYTFQRIHICTCIHTCIGTFTLTFKHTHINSHSCTSVCTYSYIHTQMCILYIQTGMHTQIDTHICTRLINMLLL